MATSSNSKNTLVQRIALDGGDQIKAELEALGESGKEAFAKLQQAATNTQQASAPLNKFFASVSKGLLTIREQAAKVGAAFDEVGASARAMGTNIAALATGEAIAIAGLVALTKSASENAESVIKGAAAAGVSTDEYQKLKFVFGQSAVGADALTVSFKKLSTNIVQAGEGTGAGAKLFDQLGVVVKDSSGNLRDTGDILNDIADRFKALPDGATKTALAIQLFGKTGAQLIPILDQGSAGIKALSTEADKLGVVLSKDDLEAGEAFQKSLNKLELAIGAVKNSIGLLLAPVFTKGFDVITQLIADNDQKFKDLGKTIDAQIIPVIQDLFDILSGKAGNDDVTKNLQGILTTVSQLAQGFVAFGQVVSFIWDSLVDAIQPFLDIINTVFGTKITAQQVLFTLAIGELLGAFKLLGSGIKAVQVTWDALDVAFGSGAARGIAIFAGLALAAGVLRAAVSRVFDTFDALTKSVSDGSNTAANSVVTAFTGATAAIGANFVALVGQLTGVWSAISGGVAQALKDIGTNIAKDLTIIEQMFVVFGEFLSGVWTDVFADFTKTFDKIKGVLVALANLGGAGGAGAAPAPQSNAEGGHIAGAGSGTSDSILSWLSNGEFVMRAKAVQKYGVAFMSALNSGRIGGFASGGLASSIPKLSTSAALAGAAASQLRPFALHIGDQIFDGLLAPEPVAASLVSYAKTRATRSAGRKPNWHRT